MLFLLNDQIVDVAVPEMHIERRWKTMGCGNPHDLSFNEVVDFVHTRLDHAHRGRRVLSEHEARDLAALVISRTGANSFMLQLRADGSTQPLLREVPMAVLDVFARGAANQDTDGELRRTGLIAAAAR